MCIGGGGGTQDTPARSPSIPILPPNILHLSASAKRQLSGKGNGVQSLSMGGKLTKPAKRSAPKQLGMNTKATKNPYDAQIALVSSGGGPRLKLPGQREAMLHALTNKQQAFNGSGSYEKQLKINLSE